MRNSENGEQYINVCKSRNAVACTSQRSATRSETQRRVNGHRAKRANCNGETHISACKAKAKRANGSGAKHMRVCQSTAERSEFGYSDMRNWIRSKPDRRGQSNGVPQGVSKQPQPCAPRETQRRVKGDTHKRTNRTATTYPQRPCAQRRWHSKRKERNIAACEIYSTTSCPELNRRKACENNGVSTANPERDASACEIDFRSKGRAA